MGRMEGAEGGENVVKVLEGEVFFLFTLKIDAY